MRQASCMSKLICLMVVLGFFVPSLIYVTFSIARIRGKSRVDQLTSDIRAEGLPASLSEASTYYDDAVGDPNLANEWHDVLQTVATIPPLEEDFEYSLAQIPLPGQDWDELERVKDYLREHQTVLDRLYSMLEKEGDVRFPDSLGIEAKLDHHKGIRIASDLLSLESRIATVERNESRLSKSIIALVRVGELLDDEPSFSALQQRVVVCHLVRQAICEASGYVSFDQTNTQGLIALLQDQRMKESLERAVIGERAALIPCFLDPSFLNEDGEASLRDYPFKYQDLKFYLMMMGDFVEASRQPFPNSIAATKLVEHRINQAMMGWNRHTKTVSGVLLPPTTTLMNAVARSEAIYLASAVCLAADMYRRKTGEWPENLQALIPEYFQLSPKDPFDGEILRYRRTETGFQVYSVGADLVDDGGKMEYREGPRHKPDIVIDWPRQIYEDLDD